MTLTLDYMVKWILLNRRGRAFRNYSEGEVYREIIESIAGKVFTYSIHEGELVGVVCGYKVVDKDEVHIWDVLTIRDGIMKELMARFLLVYPKCHITGRCRNRARDFINPTKVERLL